MTSWAAAATDSVVPFITALVLVVVCNCSSASSSSSSSTPLCFTTAQGKAAIRGFTESLMHDAAQNFPNGACVRACVRVRDERSAVGKGRRLARYTVVSSTSALVVLAGRAPSALTVRLCPTHTAIKSSSPHAAPRRSPGVLHSPRTRWHGHCVARQQGRPRGLHAWHHCRCGGPPG